MGKLDSNVTAIVSIGYSKDSIMANYKQYGFAAAMLKPYHTQELANLLEQIVNIVPKE